MSEPVPPPVPNAEETVASPCISVCTVDRSRNLCMGCLRTLQEIGAWRNMTMAEKRATVAACAERAKALPPRGPDGLPLTPRE